MLTSEIERLRIQDTAVAKVTRKLDALLAEKRLAIAPKERGRIRYHPELKDGETVVTVKLCKIGGDSTETDQHFLLEASVDGAGEIILH